MTSLLPDPSNFCRFQDLQKDTLAQEEAIKLTVLCRGAWDSSLFKHFSRELQAGLTVSVECNTCNELTTVALVL